MKIGRNERCPCGSGKKYKHCCLQSEAFTTDDVRRHARLTPEEYKRALEEYETLCGSLPQGVQPPTFMQFIGQQNAATTRHVELMSAVAGKDFSDATELQGFAQEKLDRLNAQPVDDFEGLSAGQMHTIMNQPATKNFNLVELSNRLSDDAPQAAELIKTMQWLLSHFAEKSGEVRLTENGNYPRSLCRAYCENHPQWMGPGDSVPLETSIVTLWTAHQIFLARGYTTTSSKREWLTTKGVDAYSRRRWRVLFREAVYYALDVADWLDWISEKLRFDHFTVVQDAALFLLFLLHKHRAGTIGEFIDRLTRAFPELIEPAGADQAIADFVRSVVSELFFARFCAFFGFVTIKGEPFNFPEARAAEYHTTPLFDQTFSWKV